MLKFNPENYLTFTPNSQEKLEANFIISNPSNNCSAPFKIKSTKPELFRVRPHVGVILPLQQVQVTLSTVGKNSPDLARQISNQQKFRVEYSMLDRAPASINDALTRITDANKQTHKLYINTPTPGRGMAREDHSDAKSALSNRLSYRTVRDENEDPAMLRFDERRESYGDMNSEQKFEHLKGEIDKLEKERSEVIMASKPTKRINIIALVLIFLFMVVVGNLTAKMVVHKGRPAVSKPKRKPKEYKYFGLQKLWAEEEPEEVQGPWWKFWN